MTESGLWIRRFPASEYCGSENGGVMKKRAWMLALLLTVTVAAAGCNKNDTQDKTTEQDTEAVNAEGEAEDPEGEEDDSQAEQEEPEEETKTTAQLMEEVDVEKCVTLGQYKGITVEKTITPVTDEDVEKEIQTALATYPVEVEGRAAQEGDTLNIDYVGRIDGEEFEGGSDQGADLQLGSGRFIEGFEDGLVGASKGETRTLNLTFPQDYNQELAGKSVEFTVTVNAIKAPLEEPTDEWVAANIEGYYTLEEYKAGIRSQQEETNQQTAEEQLRYAAWTQVVDNCTINEYPDSLVEMGKNLYEQQAQMYASLAGMELEDYIASSNISKEEYEANALEYGKDVAAQALVNQAICKAEGFAIGDEAYQEAVNKMSAEYGKTEEELIQAYGQDNVEQSIMMNRVSALILDNATVVEKTAEEKTGE